MLTCAQHALSALGEIGDRPRCDADRRVYSRTARRRSAARAASALGELGDRSAVEPLMAVVHDANADVRRMSFRRSANSADERALPALTAAHEGRRCLCPSRSHPGHRGNRRAAMRRIHIRIRTLTRIRTQTASKSKPEPESEPVSPGALT